MRRIGGRTGRETAAARRRRWCVRHSACRADTQTAAVSRAPVKPRRFVCPPGKRCAGRTNGAAVRQPFPSLSFHRSGACLPALKEWTAQARHRQPLSPYAYAVHARGATMEKTARTYLAGGLSSFRYVNHTHFFFFAKVIYFLHKL